MPYDHISLEQKWQKFWEENRVFHVKNPTNTNTHTNTEEKNIVSETEKDSNVSVSSVCVSSEAKPKKFILDMFPYPSGAGLHVGHPKGYTATDIVSRFYHARGFNVLHTMGWDAFGLPAENYAIKTGTHPAQTTAANIAVFKEQLHSLGFSYDWSREIDTTDPRYYQWTQWIFLELFKRGLAYEQDLPINYCPSCKTGLANEEVLADNTCDRCGTLVERRPIRQWVLRITEYADRLIEDLNGLDWPEGVKEMQRNWIGKSEGCEFQMEKDVRRGERKISEENSQKISKNKNRDEITYEIIGIAMKAHRELGGGLREETYKNAMKILLEKQGFSVELEKKVDYKIEGEKVGYGYVDILVNGIIAIELKSRKNLEGDFYKQLRAYINQSDGVEIGLLLNFYNKSLEYKRLEKDYKGTSSEIFGEKSSEIPYISVYTTRVDTVYGMTYAVLAPDHPRVYDFVTDEQSTECEAYITEAASRSDQDRTNEGKEKTGVFTGSYVVNPFNGESVPLWIADYVLGHYGTGAVMAVPAHDERDFAFAKRYKLPIKQSIARISVPEPFYAPKEGVETLYRTTVEVILENERGEICLISDNASGRDDIYLPGGGVEEGETELEAVKKEIIEETGYTDFTIIGPVENSYRHGHFHRHIKNKNQNMIGRAWYVKLDSEKRVPCEVEEGRHTMQWVKREDVKKVMNWKDHLESYWDIFQNPRATIEDGILVNSSKFDGLTSAEARKTLSEKAESEGFGRKKVNYKLRDWLFSRQRYWGEPIPLIHISNEDYARLPRVERIEDAKAGEASVLSSGGTKDLLENRADSSQARNDKDTRDDGAGEFLVINGKIYSKIYDGINGKIVIDSNLPLELPQVEKYEPAGDGQSPLATVPSFVHVELADNLNGKRETNTMPQWGGSCWYYLRYMDPANPDALASKEALEYWQNVDEYVGGAEHAVLHLLYARFWHKVLYDIGVVPTVEPFHKLTNVGLILGPDGNKMSKSKGNVINPNAIVAEYGADTLRMYEMSMGAFTDPAPWNPEAIIGVRRFLDKAYATFTEGKNLAKDDMKAMKLLHKTVKKVGEDIVEYKFNTAIAALQILLNEGLPRDAEFAREWKEKFAIILHPFAPHMAEELFHLLEKGGAEERGGGLAASENTGNQSSVSPTASQLLSQGATPSIYNAPWPSYEEFMLVDDEVTIAVQVGGKLRGTFTFLNGVGQEEVSLVVRADEGIKKWLEGKEIIKEIFIPNKMLSIVVKG